MGVDVRLIIAGGRRFSDQRLFNRRLEFFVEEHGLPRVVLCGMAAGADTLGYFWAQSKKIEIERYPADWGRFRKAAGPMRNLQMANRATHLLAFWDGFSTGTKNMIDLGVRFKLHVEVARY